MSNGPQVACTGGSFAGGTLAWLTASSARFSEPSKPYSKPSAIRNRVEAVTVNTT